MKFHNLGDKTFETDFSFNWKVVIFSVTLYFTGFASTINTEFGINHTHPMDDIGNPVINAQ